MQILRSQIIDGTVAGGRVCGAERMTRPGSDAAAEEMVGSRCGGHPGDRRKQATPTQHRPTHAHTQTRTRIQRENREKEETRGKQGKTRKTLMLWCNSHEFFVFSISMHCSWSTVAQTLFFFSCMHTHFNRLIMHTQVRKCVVHFWMCCHLSLQLLSSVSGPSAVSAVSFVQGCVSEWPQSIFFPSTIKSVVG